MKKETNHNKVKIIPLGGLEQIGMNITAFEYEDNIIVVDCGLSFPGDDMLGIDLVIPDITYLKEKFRITDTIKQKIRVILSFPLSVMPHIMLRPDHLKQIRLSRPRFSNKNMEVVRFSVSTDDCRSG